MWNSGLLHFAQQIVVAQAESAPAEAAQPGGSPYGMFIMLAGVMAIMYLFMIRPQQKREKERQAMLNSISKGDRVVTNGGMYGTVIGINEKNVVLRISDEPVVKVEMVRQSVAKVVTDSDKDSGKGK